MTVMAARIKTQPLAVYDWADVLFDERGSRDFAPLPLALGAPVADEHASPAEPPEASPEEEEAPDAWLLSRRRGKTPVRGRAERVAEFTLPYGAVYPAAGREWSHLTKAYPPQGHTALAVEALQSPRPETLVDVGEAVPDYPESIRVEQWVITAGTRPATGLVVLEFANGLRVAEVRGAYTKPKGTVMTLVRAATLAHRDEAKKCPVLRFAPNGRPDDRTTLDPDTQQDRVDQWVTGLLEAVIADWRDAAEQKVAREAERRYAAAVDADVDAILARNETTYRQMGRCLYPLNGIGWRYSGAVHYSGPSNGWNDDYSWVLPRDETLGRGFEITWMRGSIYYDPGSRDSGSYEQDYLDADYVDETDLPSAGLCGAAGADADGMCRVHAGLPYRDMNAKAWERVRAAIRARQQAETYASEAWASRSGRKREFWSAGDFHDDTDY